MLCLINGENQVIPQSPPEPASSTARTYLVTIMFDSNTSDYSGASAGEYLSRPDKSPLLWSLVLSVTLNLLFIATFLFTVVSWTKIRQWRQFKNFIFMNLVISLFMMNLSYVGCFAGFPCCADFFNHNYKLSMTAFSNWVLIMCLVIYTKILKVFSGNLQHKYYKAYVLAWGLAFVESMLPINIHSSANINFVHALTYVTIGIYLSIIFALLKLTTIRMVSNENTAQIFKIFLYVTSAFSILILTQVLFYFPHIYEYIYMGICGFELILVVSYLSMKSHWEIWDDYKKGIVDVVYEDCNLNLK